MGKYIKIKYFETERIGAEFKIGYLDIKLKQFFLKFLAKKKYICIKILSFKNHYYFFII